MLEILIVVIKVIILLGFLVTIHELGHFIVAKLCKVKVNEFAIGFGPVIFKKQGKETKYQIRAIPLGGFVSLEGEEERSDNVGSFNKVAIPKRIAIVAAGGLVNIIFALVVYMILQTSVGNNVSTKVDSILPGYAAEQSGVQQGDIIKKINGKKVIRQSDINKIVGKSDGNVLNLTIDRNGKKIEYPIVPTKLNFRQIN